MEKLSLRPATREDMRLIFEWRNDPWIVERGLSGRTVTLDEHQAWFGKALENPAVKIFVAEVNGEPAGQARLQRITDDEAEITVYLMKEFTGRGFGVAAIKEGAAAALASWPVRRIVARILRNNKESVRAFDKARFAIAATQPDANYTVMILERGV